MADSSSPAARIELSEVRKTYNAGLPSEAEVLHGLSLRVDAGEFIALIGPSGSGKSTLLNIVGLLERMTSGAYTIQGEEVQSLDDTALTLRRRGTLGFVFQFHHLLPAFTALENVTLPALMREGRVSSAQLQRARTQLAQLDAQLDGIGVDGSDRAFNLTWHDWINLKNLIAVSRVIALSALAREDSRGAHFREDFPDTGGLDTSRYIVVRQRGDELELTREPVRFTRVAPGQTLLAEA